MSDDAPHIPERDHQQLSFVVPCDACKSVTERRIGPPGSALPTDVACESCSETLALDFVGHVTGTHELDGCPRCGYHTLCIQKDVNPKLGVLVVTATYAVILALRLDLQATLITLVALTAVDLFALRLLVKRVFICYRCKAHYRGFVPGPRCRPFDLATWEAHTPPAEE